MRNSLQQALHEPVDRISGQVRTDQVVDAFWPVVVPPTCTSSKPAEPQPRRRDTPRKWITTLVDPWSSTMSPWWPTGIGMAVIDGKDSAAECASNCMLDEDQDLSALVSPGSPTAKSPPAAEHKQ